MKCLFEKCNLPAVRRGLCHNHSQLAHQRVIKGLITWDQLIAAGLALPKKCPGRTPFGRALDAACDAIHPQVVPPKPAAEETNADIIARLAGRTVLPNDEIWPDQLPPKAPEVVQAPADAAPASGDLDEAAGGRLAYAIPHRFVADIPDPDETESCECGVPCVTPNDIDDFKARVEAAKDGEWVKIPPGITDLQLAEAVRPQSGPEQRYYDSEGNLTELGSETFAEMIPEMISKVGGGYFGDIPGFEHRASDSSAAISTPHSDDEKRPAIDNVIQP